jgi:hypothetical protein
LKLLFFPPQGLCALAQVVEHLLVMVLSGSYGFNLLSELAQDVFILLLLARERLSLCKRLLRSVKRRLGKITLCAYALRCEGI